MEFGINLSAVSIEDDEMHYLEVVCEGPVVQAIYVDGVLVDSLPIKSA